MGYLVIKRGPSWRVVFEQIQSGQRLYKHVSKKHWADLGLRANMPIEQAREKLRAINAREQIGQERKLKAQARIEAEARIECAFLPLALVSAFEAHILLARMSHGNQKRFHKQSIYWRAAQRLIRDIARCPSEWADQPELIWQWFIKRRYSLSHVQKILRPLNQWGAFYAKQMRLPFLPVRNPRGIWSGRIHEAFQRRHPQGLKSKPLTLEHLNRAKQTMAPEHYRFLYVQLYFGLRPSELEGMAEGRISWHVEKQDQVEVLVADQPKLAAIVPEERAKMIPILRPEQREALIYLREGKLKKPHSKTIQRHLGAGVRQYAGRKGFVDLAIDQWGKPLDVVAAWAGHAKPETTLRHYKNRRKARL